MSLTLHKPTLAAALLHELVGPAQNEADVKLEFFERAKGDDGSTHIQKMIDILKGANGSVGALLKVAAYHEMTICLLIVLGSGDP